MQVHSFQRMQKLPAPMEDVWSFFSNPENLVRITPADMDFRIISSLPGSQIYTGQLITYTVRPLFGIKWTWITEIKDVRPHEFFVDEQKKGPYAYWHHAHYFSVIPGAVLMKDEIDYAVPLGRLGDLFSKTLVKRKLAAIFDFREKKINELFGKFPA